MLERIQDLAKDRWELVSIIPGSLARDAYGILMPLELIAFLKRPVL